MRVVTYLFNLSNSCIYAASWEFFSFNIISDVILLLYFGYLLLLSYCYGTLTSNNNGGQHLVILRYNENVGGILTTPRDLI